MQTPEQTIVYPFSVNLNLKHIQSPVNVGFIEPDHHNKPFHISLTKLFQDEFKAGGDEFTLIRPDGKFPKDAKVGVSIVDDGLDKERLPRALYGKHEKPRDGKKAVYLFTTPVLPDNVRTEDNSLSSWMRGLMVRNACHIAVVIEGEASATDLRLGARAVVSTMEGNTQVITYNGDTGEFINNIAKRLRIQASAHMVTRKEGVKVEAPTFEAWRTRPEVEEFPVSSQILAARGLLRDSNLRAYASLIQTEGINRALRQAGASEGNLAAVVKEFAGRNAVMAITETGIKKTQIDPAKGEVVAVTDLLPDGARYLILKGLPVGHPRTFFRHPSQATFVEVMNGFVSAFRRGRTREYFRNMPRREAFIDHPFSVETVENIHSFRFMALREKGVVNSVPEYLQYYVLEFQKSPVNPIIPPGVEIGPNAALHVHETHRNKQWDPLIKVVPIEMADEDMERLGFIHNPPCGAAESIIALLMQLDHSYEIHGLPESEDEIRIGHMRWHGVFGWGRKGPRNLAQRFADNTQFEPYVKR